MVFDADGMAILISPGTGRHATGTWEQLADGEYLLTSASGTVTPLLILDPLSGTLHTDDYAIVFVREEA